MKKTYTKKRENLINGSKGFTLVQVMIFMFIMLLSAGAVTSLITREQPRHKRGHSGSALVKLAESSIYHAVEKLKQNPGSTPDPANGIIARSGGQFPYGFYHVIYEPIDGETNRVLLTSRAAVWYDDGSPLEDTVEMTAEIEHIRPPVINMPDAYRGKMFVSHQLFTNNIEDYTSFGNDPTEVHIRGNIHANSSALFNRVIAGRFNIDGDISVTNGRIRTLPFAQLWPNAWTHTGDTITEADEITYNDFPRLDFEAYARNARGVLRGTESYYHGDTVFQHGEELQGIIFVDGDVRIEGHVRLQGSLIANNIRIVPFVVNIGDPEFHITKGYLEHIDSDPTREHGRDVIVARGNIRMHFNSIVAPGRAKLSTDRALILAYGHITLRHRRTTILEGGLGGTTRTIRGMMIAGGDIHLNHDYIIAPLSSQTYLYAYSRIEPEFMLDETGISPGARLIGLKGIRRGSWASLNQ